MPISTVVINMCNNPTLLLTTWAFRKNEIKKCIDTFSLYFAVTSCAHSHTLCARLLCSLRAHMRAFAQFATYFRTVPIVATEFSKPLCCWLPLRFINLTRVRKYHCILISNCTNRYITKQHKLQMTRPQLLSYKMQTIMVRVCIVATGIAVRLLVKLQSDNPHLLLIWPVKQS